MKILIWLLTFLPTVSFAFSMNDITVLLPLPKSSDLSHLLRPTSDGAKGPLLPKEVYSNLPPLLDDEPSPKVYSEMLHLMAIRLDPCFVEGKGPMACKKQIRMIWQPLYDFDGEIVTRDAAIHTFYEFDDNEWQFLIRAWKALPSVDVSQPLQIHPTLSTEGYSGSYWTNLKATLLEFCGRQNLTRATAMTVMNGEQVWAFAGLDVKPGALSPIMIPRIGRRIQGLIMGTSNNDEFFGSMRPPPQEDPELEALLMDSGAMKQNERELKELMSRIYSYENPKLHNPGTLDCVSCHIAQAAREWTQRSFAHWDWQNDFKQTEYVSSLNIDNVTAGFKTNHFRALGYFHNKPKISQRVINETSETAATLNHR